MMSQSDLPTASAVAELLNEVARSFQSSPVALFAEYSLATLASVAVLSVVGNLMSRNVMDDESTSINSSVSLPEGSPYGESNSYDANLAKAYFSKRPLQVAARGLEITNSALYFGLLLLSDYVTGKLTDPAQEALRADQLTDILTKTGPTFIKVGQSLSIRSDLLRPAYIVGLTKLQDKVPPFPTTVARRIIEEELGQPIENIFSSGIEPTSTVVAAASLGQVFKAVLRADGSEVAVKIQRPDILTNVALDMHLLRELFVPVKAIFQLNTDLAGLIDEW